MAIIFNGREFAKKKEELLREKISLLKVKPKLVSILVGNDTASVLYTSLKQKAAVRVGAKFQIIKISLKGKQETQIIKEIIVAIEKCNKDKSVNGVMVQLPLPDGLQAKRNKILSQIAKEKDVDGLRQGSAYLPATVVAIKEIVEEATRDLAYFGKKAAVVGARGTVGRGVVKILEKMGYKVCQCDKETRDLYSKLTMADLVVSATGVPNIIKPEMVKEGLIAIDVGAPKGDFDPKTSEKASFFTPVPGGVGPVTIVSLLENLVESVNSRNA